MIRERERGARYKEIKREREKDILSIILIYLISLFSAKSYAETQTHQDHTHHRTHVDAEWEWHIHDRLD